MDRSPTGRARTGTAATAVAGLIVLGAVPAAAAPAPGGSTQKCLHSAQPYTGATPWAVRRLSAERVWPLSRGAGVLVAVIGSGIDAGNAQFAPGQVLPGSDLIDGGAADDDCDGAGTFVAGLVAARPTTRTLVAGVAPAATLLPVRITQSTESGNEPPTPEKVAQGIEYALNAGAKIVVVYEAASGPSASLSRAVARAGRERVAVVAGGRAGAAGTSEPTDQLHPCSLAGVIGVAGVDSVNQSVAGSCSGPGVDVAAPGADLVSTAAGPAPGLRHVRLGADAPGYAAGYAAGVLALLLAREPGLTPSAAAARLTRTADPAPSGRRDDRLGWGVVDPYAALTELPGGAGRPGGAGPRTPPAPFQVATSPPGTSYRGPVLLSLALLLGAVTAVLLAAILRAGRSRGWRPGDRRTRAGLH